MNLAVESFVQNLSSLKGIVQLQERERLLFSKLPVGFPCGAVTEIAGRPGHGKTGFLLDFLSEQQKQHSQFHAAWVERSFTLYPRAFSQKGVMLSRLLFLEAKKDRVWSVLELVKSQLFSVVIGSLGRLEGMDLRRLQLATERAQVSLILLSSERTMQSSWPIYLQVEVSQGEVVIHRSRG